MKATLKAVLATSLFLAPAAFATKIPIPVEGASLNVSVQVQTQAMINESGAPNGNDMSYDIFVRRTRVLVNGDISPNFTYLFQIDNANFGKFGNFTGRAIVQDAWVGWAPLGQTGGNVIYIDAGLLLIPVAHSFLESTTNFITADLQSDAARVTGNPFPAFRDTGLQIRGWWFDKKVGFRGGVYEGFAPIDQPAGTCTATGAGCITPKRYPQFAGFVNFDIIGTEEGGWLYGAYKWGKDPILSVGGAAVYQSQAIRNTSINAATPNITDQKLFTADVYLNLPQSESSELVVEATGYIDGNGSGSNNTGKGFSAAAGYRMGTIAPYVAIDYFRTDDCSALTLTTAQTTACNASVDLGNSRNLKAGLNFFFNKNLNHLNLELQFNHGVSAYGPQNITVANAGYAPTLKANGSAVPSAQNTSLKVPTQMSFLAHWNLLF
ncbi:MAG: hypothetical protein ACXWLR_00170 [Myxococcales bacterium]